MNLIVSHRREGRARRCGKARAHQPKHLSPPQRARTLRMIKGRPNSSKASDILAPAAAQEGSAAAASEQSAQGREGGERKKSAPLLFADGVGVCVVFGAW